MKLLKITQPQFKILAQNNINSGKIELLKLFAGDSPLKSIDIETFAKWVVAINNLSLRLQSNGKISMGWQRDFLVNHNYSNEEIIKIVKNIIKLHKKYPSALLVFRDAVNSNNNLDPNTQPDIDWMFKDYASLVRTHDGLIEISEAQREERRRMWSIREEERNAEYEKKRKEIDEKRKDKEFVDESFSILLPKSGSELVTEGTAQQICIGGYVSSHSQGQTNIYFLRKNENLDTPFYAIELDNNNVIRQIHGKCNRWLGNNPEAIPTVLKWIKKNNIKCDENILTNTATGYSPCNVRVPLPNVEIVA